MEISSSIRFPAKTLLAVGTCLVALGAWRHWRDGAKGISWAIVGETLGRPTRKTTEPVLPIPTDTAHEASLPNARSSAAARDAQPRSPISPVLFDDSGALDPFFAALQGLEATTGARSHVIILHYGDSPTTADLITGDVRAMLQLRFGDGGHGYLLIAKPWAWYGHRDTDISSRGWTISTAVGKGHGETYGVGGASFTGTAGAESHITLKDAPANASPTNMVLSFLAQPGGGTVTITADLPAGATQSAGTIDTAGDIRQPAWQSLSLPAGTKAVDIKVASGHVELFGESFERPGGGLLYDSLGLNGASTTVLSRGFDADAWAAELRHDRPTLVIINYGTNESSFGSFVDRQYESELRLAIRRIRNALPGVSILVMSPMDRGERAGIADISTMATIPRIVAIQKHVAEDTGCAFFDTFDAMGGDGTMARWYAGHPRLVAGDLIHPTPQGAAIVAELFVKNLSLGYDAYKALTPRTSRAAASSQSSPGQQPVQP